MPALRLSIGIALAASAVAGTAGADPAFDQLERALPAGWTLLATSSELVIRHDRPCYVTGTVGRAAGGPDAAAGPVVVSGGGPLVTIELRYRIEPRWTAQQITAARSANDQLAGEMRALASRYRIDAIPNSKGRPQPASADQRARLEAYDAGRARLTARRAKLPRCSLGGSSVFDSDDTYAQLRLQVDPPDVMTQAHRIVELVKQYCR